MDKSVSVGGLFSIQGTWTISQFDDVDVTNSFGSLFMTLSCYGTDTISDATWSNITIPYTSGVNIDASYQDCTVANLGTAVSVTGGGSRYGAAYENDRNNVFSWP
jgi:hypothetical protein